MGCLLVSTHWNLFDVTLDRLTEQTCGRAMNGDNCCIRLKMLDSILTMFFRIWCTGEHTFTPKVALISTLSHTTKDVSHSLKNLHSNADCLKTDHASLTKSKRMLVRSKLCHHLINCMNGDIIYIYNIYIIYIYIYIYIYYIYI